MKVKCPGKLIFWLSALALLAVIAAACAPAAPAPTATPAKAAAPAATATTAPPPATATTAPPPKPTTPPVTKIKIAKSYAITVSLAWFIADKEGYYKEEGLEVEFVRAPGTAGLAAMAAGEILVADGSSSSMNATMEGAPFRVVMTTGRMEAYNWARDPIKKAADLVGKKFACSSAGDANCLASQQYMKNHGLEDIT
ncbi:MAG: ABC transporter substrate-binding protein, partial [Dehalococcoidia bacterium]|nr:ABC transporter substrate-binding protein [Dehalococcoidia bacterium]